MPTPSLRNAALQVEEERAADHISHQERWPHGFAAPVAGGAVQVSIGRKARHNLAGAVHQHQTCSQPVTIQEVELSRSASGMKPGTILPALFTSTRPAAASHDSGSQGPRCSGTRCPLCSSEATLRTVLTGHTVACHKRSSMPTSRPQQHAVHPQQGPRQSAQQPPTVPLCAQPSAATLAEGGCPGTPEAAQVLPSRACMQPKHSHALPAGAPLTRRGEPPMLPVTTTGQRTTSATVRAKPYLKP